MNYFIEGLQGSGKSTMSAKLSGLHPGHTVLHEGDYSPVELAWCAYTKTDEYPAVLEKYGGIREQIVENSHDEGDHIIICYTRVQTDDASFYKDMEQYEIYNGRIPYENFADIIKNRYARWDTDDLISECSLFQNIVSDMMLFRNMTDEEIIGFYRELARIIRGKDIHIVYLYTDDAAASLDVIRKERVDADGNEVWFSMLCGFFDESPYAAAHNLHGADGIIAHLEHRQELEIKLCKELFADKFTLLHSKKYTDTELALIP